MASNTFRAEFAKTGRSSCKNATCKSKKIQAGELRLVKLAPNPFAEGDLMATNYHPQCLFEALTRAKKQTKKITGIEDIGNFGELASVVQKNVRVLVDSSGQQWYGAFGDDASKTVQHTLHGKPFPLDLGAGVGMQSTTPNDPGSPKKAAVGKKRPLDKEDRDDSFVVDDELEQGNEMEDDEDTEELTDDETDSDHGDELESEDNDLEKPNSTSTTLTSHGWTAELPVRQKVEDEAFRPRKKQAVQKDRQHSDNKEVQSLESLVEQQQPDDIGDLNIQTLVQDATPHRYQEEGVRWLIWKQRQGVGSILGDEMGLGKTLQSIAALSYHRREEGGPYLIITPLSTIQNWESELRRFTPQLKVTNYTGSGPHRYQLRQTIVDFMHKHQRNHARESLNPPLSFDVLLTTYEMIIAADSAFLSRFRWQCTVIDEGHRLKNCQSQLTRKLLDVYSLGTKVVLTGTPVQNNVTELWSLLHFINPCLFPAGEEKTFSQRFSKEGQEHHGTSSALHRMLRPFLLRRTKKSVADELGSLPPKSELVLFTPLSDMQRKYYKALLTKDTTIWNGDNRQGLNNLVIQLRKCCSHPYHFSGAEPEPFTEGEHLILNSGKLQVLDLLLRQLKEQGHRVLVFCQMAQTLDILQDYLQYRGYSYERLDGSVRGEERFASIQKFSKDDQIFVFLLSTRAGGLGLNLTVADTVVIFDSDWNPQADLQAQARVHRIGQTRPVTVYRLVVSKTIDEVIFRRTNRKLELAKSVIDDGQFTAAGVGAGGAGEFEPETSKIVDMLKFGFSDMLACSAESAPASTSMSIDDILKSAQVVGSSTALEDGGSGEKDNSPDDADDIYFYNGLNFSKEARAKDKDSFEQMLQEAHTYASADAGLGRRTKVAQRTLSQVQFETKEEAHLRKQAEREAARKKKWEKNEYTSTNLPAADVEVGPAASQESPILFVAGDASRPGTGPVPAEFNIICHCVDNSGKWGRGGFFDCLATKGNGIVPRRYELAGKMNDLQLGAAHFIPLGDSVEPPTAVVLLVCQKRSKTKGVSGVDQAAFSEGLARIASNVRAYCDDSPGNADTDGAGPSKKPLDPGCRVHMPRVGAGTPGFSWYSIERVIRKQLSDKGLSTAVYYFRPKGKYS